MIFSELVEILQFQSKNSKKGPKAPILMVMHHIGCLKGNKNSHDLRILVCKILVLYVLTNLMSDILAEKVSDEIFISTHSSTFVWNLKQSVLSCSSTSCTDRQVVCKKAKTERGKESANHLLAHMFRCEIV